jgi:hypothetical protein
MHAEFGLVAALLAAAALAWGLTADRMAGMDAGPGTALGSLGWFTGVWAMMLPSLAPTAAVYTALVHREPSRVLLFAGSYLFVWSAAGGHTGFSSWAGSCSRIPWSGKAEGGGLRRVCWCSSRCIS